MKLQCGKTTKPFVQSNLFVDARRITGPHANSFFSMCFFQRASACKSFGQLYCTSPLDQCASQKQITISPTAVPPHWIGFTNVILRVPSLPHSIGSLVQGLMLLRNDSAR